MNVIWIIADTLRRDAVGVYGSRKVRTPAIDSLAKKSMRFNRHYAASFPTMPARADFATGRWTLSFMQWEPLPQDQVTLAQLLSKKRIHTAAVVDTPFYIRNGMNYDRGFRTFHEIPGQSTNAAQVKELRATWRDESDRFAPRTFGKAMWWLESHYKEEFFLYIDTWDPHEAWDAPSYYTEPYWPGYDGEIIDPPYGRWQEAPGYTEEKVKKALATYWGKVVMVDTWIGRLLRQLENMNLMEKTAIIISTDHGFYFGEHNGLFGKASRVETPGDKASVEGEMGQAWVHSAIYEEVSAIPLSIYVPGIAAGNYDGLTSAIDLMPTVLDLNGLQRPSYVEGRSLLPMVKNPSLPGREYVVTSHLLANPGETTRMVDDNARKIDMATTPTITTKEWSLICAVEPGLSELYHLTEDPKQEKNVINTYPDKAREIHSLFVKFMQETKVSKDRMGPRLELRL